MVWYVSGSSPTMGTGMCTPYSALVSAYLSTIVNTGYDSIEKLEEKVATLEKEKKEQASALKGAVNSANSSSNKVDELKKIINGLEKRLKKLEDKA